MATMSEVARRAGVSLSTVSYALSGVRPISDETRERINEAMRALDFTPNAVAQGLASRRTRILAMVVPTDEMPLDPFSAALIVGAAEAARESGHHLLLWTEPASKETEIKELLALGLIDGAIVLSVRMDDERIHRMRDAGLPLTTLGRTDDPGEMPYVDTDAAQSARLALEHLVELGCSTVAYVAPDSARPELGYGITVRLWQELQASAESLGVELRSMYADRTHGQAAPRIAEFLREHPGTSGVIAHGDEMVAGSLTGSLDAGRRIPDDLSVVGLLTTELVAQMVTPTLTTVSPDPAELGRQAARAMVAHLTTGALTQELVESTLTIRGTSAVQR